MLALRLPPEHPMQPRVPVSADALIEALPLAMLVVDGSGHIRHLNPAAEELIGDSARRVVGKHLSDLWPAHMLDALMARAWQDNAMVTEHAHVLEQFQRRLEVRVRVVPLADDSVMLLLEPHDKRDAFAADEAKQRIAEASGLMAAMLAHEIKNPLAGIRGAAQLLEGDSEAALTALICREVDRIRDMVERVESLSEAKGLPVQPVNVHEVLREACELLRSASAMSLDVEELFDPSLPPVMAARVALGQIFLNLLKNAQESMQGNGVIRIRTSAHYGHMRHADEMQSAYAAINIEDSGPGIAEEIKARLFEPFATTRGRGRGLGLAVTAQLASGMGGHIELVEKQEAGAHFRLLLPLYPLPLQGGGAGWGSGAAYADASNSVETDPHLTSPLQGEERSIREDAKS